MRVVIPAVPPVRRSVDGVAWPSLPTGRPATLANLVHELDRTQWLPRATVLDRQYAQLRVLAHGLAAAVPFFQKRLAAASLVPDDLGTPEGLARLPPLSREELVAAGPEAFAAAVPRDHDPISEAKTSGSTGAPVTVRRTSVTSLLWDALTIRDHLWRGIDFRQRVLANRFGVKEPLELPNWGPPVSALFPSAPLAALPLLGPVEALADRCLEFGAEILVVYPSVLDALLVHFRSLGTRPEGLRYVHTYAEPLAPALREAAASELGVTVWETYSCEEIGNIASLCPDGDANHVFAESVLVEILDDDDQPCEEGAIGRVVVTDLHNFATPLVRYDLGDYAQAASQCSCRRGLPTIGRVLGRETNRFRRLDGAWVWPSLPPLVALREHAPLRAVQVVQHGDDVTLEVVAVADRTVSPLEEEALSQALRSALGPGFALRYDWRPHAPPRTRGGKFEPFRREIRTHRAPGSTG